jgi:outer membrane protein TolC
MILRHFPSLPRQAALVAYFLGALAGCIHYQSRPISPGDAANAFTARSLSDEGLRRFLAQNLRSEPAPWPLPIWDFEELSWVAFYYQPSLDVARAQWDVARNAAKTAATHPNPTLTLIPGYDTSVSGGVSPWFPSIGLDFLIETAHKRDHHAAMERLAAESARLNIQAAVWQVRGELRRALVELAATEQRRKLLRDQVALEQEIVTLLERRREVGAASALEVSAARMAWLKAETVAADAERQAPLAHQRVAQALGVSPAALEGVQFADMLAVSAPSLSAEELAAVRRVSLQSRADILDALARYEATEAALQLEVARQYPDIHFGPGYQYDLGENKWSLALALELPVFHRNQGPLAAAEARRREAAAQFIATQARAIAEIDGAVAAQAAAADRLAHLRGLQLELQKHAKLVQARLAVGETDRLENQNTKSELKSGELALLDAQVGAVAAVGQLEDTLQVPFQNLAAAVNLQRDVATSRLP